MKARSQALMCIALMATLDNGAAREREQPPACESCIEFEAPLALGTLYGSPIGQLPGSAILISSGILVSLRKFEFMSGGGAFNAAMVQIPPVAFGLNQVMNLNNINLEFDFGGVGFSPTRVQFEFLDLGGIENLSVNGSPVFAGDLVFAPSPMGSVDVSVYTAAAGGHSKGIVVLTGPIKEFTVGGQEFYLDRICLK